MLDVLLVESKPNPELVNILMQSQPSHVLLRRGLPIEAGRCCKNVETTKFGVEI